MGKIAIIPVRSGSKGLKDKNIRELNGKPLVAYSIESAIQSGKYERVFVSTDSPHYADIAKAYGADCSFLRSPGTSTDGASTWVCPVCVRGRLRGAGVPDCRCHYPNRILRIGRPGFPGRFFRAGLHCSLWINFAQLWISLWIMWITPSINPVPMDLRYVYSFRDWAKTV